jgi:hypothetical protein
MSNLNTAWRRALVSAAAPLALVACAGTPPQLTNEDLIAISKSARAEDICNYREPTGSHIPTWVCLTPAEDLAQRELGHELLRRGLEAPLRL